MSSRGGTASGGTFERGKEVTSFNRGLDRQFVGFLNEEYEKHGWWRKLVDDQDLFVAIRENYVSIYYCGCSLLKLTWNGQSVMGQTHYKYLLRPNFDDQYVEIKDGIPKLPNDLRHLFLRNFSSIDQLKAAARPYAGPEKIGVHNIISSNSNVLDVEVAFGRTQIERDDPSTPRIDLSSIKKGSEEASIVFFEAKHFENRKDLRARKETKPKAVRQIENYSNILAAHRDAIIKSYFRVCHNFLHLRGMETRYPERHEILRDIVNGRVSLNVNVNPVLLVFGFDDDQRTGRAWEFHRNKLISALGKQRALFRGGSKGFKRGVSK